MNPRNFLSKAFVFTTLCTSAALVSSAHAVAFKIFFDGHVWHFRPCP